MLSLSNRFLYLHIPKTGGNAIQTVLEPLSDDRKVLSSGHHGKDRFNVQGPATPRKHATLQEYGGEIRRSVQLVVSCRHPVHRLISFYFSPQRWLREDRTSWELIEAKWDVEDFRNMLPDVKPMVDFLMLDGALCAPDHVIRFEHLRSDFQAVLNALKLDTAARELPWVNKTKADIEQVNAARRSRVVIDAAVELYSKDFEFFGYPLP